MTTQPEKLAVGIREAAQMLSVSPRTIQNYLRAKVLSGRKIGRRTVIPVVALQRFLRSDHATPEVGTADSDDPAAAQGSSKEGIGNGRG